MSQHAEPLRSCVLARYASDTAAAAPAPPESSEARSLCAPPLGVRERPVGTSWHRQRPSHAAARSRARCGAMFELPPLTPTDPMLALRRPNLMRLASRAANPVRRMCTVAAEEAAPGPLSIKDPTMQGVVGTFASVYVAVIMWQRGDKKLAKEIADHKAAHAPAEPEVSPVVAAVAEAAPAATPTLSALAAPAAVAAPGASPADWKVVDVCAWLDSIELGVHAPAFKTHAVARSTAYDFNVQMDHVSLINQKKSTAEINSIFTADNEECFDVKEHEIVYQDAKVSKRSTSQRLRVLSSINNMAIDAETAAKLTRAGIPRPYELADYLKLNPDRVDTVEDILLENFNYIGVAITPHKMVPQHSKQDSQGFVATRGGLNTMINSGNKQIHPGQRIRVGLNFDKLDKSYNNQFAAYSMSSSGVPFEKATLATMPVDDSSVLNYNTVLSTIKSMYNKKTMGNKYVEHKIEVDDPDVLGPPGWGAATPRFALEMMYAGINRDTAGFLDDRSDVEKPARQPYDRFRKYHDALAATPVDMSPALLDVPGRGGLVNVEHKYIMAVHPNMASVMEASQAYDQVVGHEAAFYAGDNRKVPILIEADTLEEFQRVFYDTVTQMGPEIAAPTMVEYYGVWKGHVSVEIMKRGAETLASNIMGLLRQKIQFQSLAGQPSAAVTVGPMRVCFQFERGFQTINLAPQQVGPDLDNLHETDAADPMVVLLSKMTNAGSDLTGIARSPIASLVMRTIECTAHCVVDQMRRTSDRTIGIALSGAAPGNPFDICLTSAV